MSQAGYKNRFNVYLWQWVVSG